MLFDRSLSAYAGNIICFLDAGFAGCHSGIIFIADPTVVCFDLASLVCTNLFQFVVRAFACNAQPHLFDRANK